MRHKRDRRRDKFKLNPPLMLSFDSFATAASSLTGRILKKSDKVGKLKYKNVVKAKIFHIFALFHPNFVTD